jgi:hypothetical protein
LRGVGTPHATVAHPSCWCRRGGGYIMQPKLSSDTSSPLSPSLLYRIGSCLMLRLVRMVAMRWLDLTKWRRGDTTLLLDVF